MGRGLFAHEPVFRASIEQCDAAFGRLANWSIAAELHAAESRFENTEIAQPMLFAVQMGLAALWRSWGIEPDTITGHSVGEVAAACVAGVLSLEDAIRVVYHRGRLMQRTHGRGAMAAVAIPAAALADYSDRVSISAVNSPVSTVISGEPEAVREVLAELRAKGVRCRELNVAYAFHHAQMDALLEEFASSIPGIEPLAGTVPMVSSVTGESRAGRDYDVSYWVRNLREPVRFASAMEQLVNGGHSLFLEIGAHPVLGVNIAECLSALDREGVAIASLRRDADEQVSMLESLGRFYTAGHSVDWRKVYPAGRVVPLPKYPWQHERYWIEGAEPNGAPANDWLHAVEWRPAARRTVEAAEHGSWLILDDSRGTGGELAGVLQAQGEQCSVVAPGVEYDAAGAWRGVVFLRSLDAAMEDSLRASCGGLLELVQRLATRTDLGCYSRCGIECCTSARVGTRTSHRAGAPRVVGRPDRYRHGGRYRTRQ